MDHLPRKLNLLDATFIVVGIVIGSGIFLLPNLIARRLPSGPVIIAVWVVAGILSFFGALAYAELGAMLPATGGQYVYLREAYGPMCAFLCGWVFTLAATPGGVAFLSVGFSIYLAHFIPLSPPARTAVSLALVAVLSLINYVGVREAAWIQRIFTSAKIAGLALVIGAAFLAPHATHTAPAAAVLSYSGIGFAMTACLMAYNGWSYVSFVAGEVKQPERNVPRSLVLGMALVMILYVGANLAYMNVMTVPEIAATERVGAAVAERAMGPAGASILSMVVLLSVIGAINGCLLTAPRIPFRPSQRRIILQPVRQRPSPFQNAVVRHRRAGALDRPAHPDGLLRDARVLHSSLRLDVLHAWAFWPSGSCGEKLPMRRGPIACGAIRPRSGCLWSFRSGIWRTHS